MAEEYNNSENLTSPYYLAHVNFVQDVQMVTCGWVPALEPGQRCSYVLNTPQCTEDVFIFNYIELFYCLGDTSNMAYVGVGIACLLLTCSLLFLTLGSTADGFFCPSLKVLSAMMNLNENVAGVTLLAFGNCAPDMITSITGLTGESRRLYSDTLGAGVFVVFCVAGSIIAFVPFIAEQATFLRDCLFLLLAVVYIDWSLKTDAAITIMEGASSEVFTRLSNQAQFEIRSRSFSHERLSIPYHSNHGANFMLFRQFLNSINPIDDEEWSDANKCGKLVIMVKTPIVFLLKLLIPSVDFELEDHGWSKLLNSLQIIVLPNFIIYCTVTESFLLKVPYLMAYTILLTIPFFVLVFLTTRTDTTPKLHKYFSILSALGSVYIIYACAAETISILSVLGLTTHRSNSFLGCTLLAWGNSIGDLVANVALARQGYQKMGFAACIGGPLFNTLIGVGIGMTYKAAIHSDLRTNKKTDAEGTMGVNNTVFMIIGLVLFIYAASTTRYILRRGIGIFMLLIYTVYMIYTVLGEIEIIHTFGNDHRLDVKLEESDLLDLRIKQIAFNWTY